jgi:alkylation response protein AidB-like acyl-CoA dehydrogenase
MALELSAEDLAFRDEVRAFLADKLPRRLSDKVKEGRRLTKADMEEWHAILAEKGWLANHWPREWGGCDWSVVQKFVFEVETAMAGAPRIVPFGLSMLGPVLIKYGNEAQRRHWLPRIVDGSDWWCQGFSEPGAGSDLASLSCRAERRGDVYVVNGQKTWTTLAQYADMIFCLVRTSTEGRKQEGISFLLIDMKSPGVEVRPIRLLDGDCEVNEVFFSDVEVPADNLVGEENKGWTYAKYLLTYERTNIAGIGASMAAFERLKLAATTAQRGGRPLAEDPAFALRMAELEIDLENMKTTNLRALAAAGAGRDGQSRAPGAESSMLKIRGTEIRQKITELMLRAAGPHARPWLPDWLDEGANYHRPGPDFAPAVAASYFNNRKLSIFGGSNEVQRDIIAKMILGL